MAQDPHQGGRLEDMAAAGTSVPNDAGLHRTIPSVPRPDQIDPPADTHSHPNPAHAADNTFDIPRGTRDQGVTGEILTGTGDQMSSNVEKKSFDDAPFDSRAKGSDQYYKHARQGNDFDKFAKAGHGVQAASGEEEDTQDALLDRRGAK
ncbi:uncharacterized protein N0V89_007138 [Didymosphaeria variabile]|uniref:Uncharacterized protein n=1 Tax=Didymosphaeria variabile TaxID=1932322 RepID=A0A9W8XIV9_9PLEO|nr:uncharacterized protein N0V89_007138 [Didymosphaeria variabile]KAJ4351794.1 hypothetical protein N0V89_007138 [Didymosphaeria variabile]